MLCSRDVKGGSAASPCGQLLRAQPGVRRAGLAFRSELPRNDQRRHAGSTGIQERWNHFLINVP